MENLENYTQDLDSLFSNPLPSISELRKEIKCEHPKTKWVPVREIDKRSQMYTYYFKCAICGLRIPGVWCSEKEFLTYWAEHKKPESKMESKKLF